jgi:charged multivesicular body protein 4
LRRKKQYEVARDQTQGHIIRLEQEIYSIETANINKETLEAMKNAGKAMKEIHGGLTIEKVDQTMYVLIWSVQGKRRTLLTGCDYREELRDQHAIVEEIGEAITQNVGGQLDETELDEELEQMQQEQLDNEMLSTGHVPVGDKVSAMPSTPQTGKQIYPYRLNALSLIQISVKGKAPAVEEDEEEAELRKLQAEMAL